MALTLAVPSLFQLVFRKSYGDCTAILPSTPVAESRSRMGEKIFKLAVGPSEKSPVPFITFLPPVRFATTAQLSQSVCPVIANRSRPPIENVERGSVAVAVHASLQSVEDLWLALYLRML